MRFGGKLGDPRDAVNNNNLQPFVCFVVTESIIPTIPTKLKVADTRNQHPLCKHIDQKMSSSITLFGGGN